MSKQHAVLVVGDDDVFTELLGRLPPTDYTLSYASGLGESLAQLEQQRPAAVVAVLDGGETLDDLLTQARARGVRACIGVTCTGFDPPGADQCNEVLGVDELERLPETLGRLLGAEHADEDDEDKEETSPGGRSRSKALDQRVRDLERRVREVAVGATHGLSELLQATDGLNQGLKLHARLLGELEQRVAAGADGKEGEAKGAATTEGSVAAKLELEQRLAGVTERLESLESRVGDVAFGATGGLSELLQATDGLGQGLKAQARAMSELERRLQEVSGRQTEWQAEVDAARAAASKPTESKPVEGLEEQLAPVRERLDSLEVRLGEVALGITGGLSELLQATDGLGQGLKTQARALSELERRLGEQQERLDALEKEPGEA